MNITFIQVKILFKLYKSVYYNELAEFCKCLKRIQIKFDTLETNVLLLIIIITEIKFYHNIIPKCVSVKSLNNFK